MNDPMGGFGWLPDYRDIIACEQKKTGNTKEKPLPPEMLQEEEEHYWQDLSYLLGLLPFMAREIWAVLDAVLDQYEYQDSPIYVENPDGLTLEKIADQVYEKLVYYEKQQTLEAPDGTQLKNYYYILPSEEVPVMTPLRLLIQVLLIWNISDRRQRYWRRAQVFHGEKA